MDLKQAIADFVKRADEVTAKYWEASKLTYAAAPVHEVEYGEKWAKVYTMNEHEGRRHERGSIYCFIALCDFQTKMLGTIKTGDIHKAASYKAPAKHKRGNVFDDVGCCTPHGIAYLR